MKVTVEVQMRAPILHCGSLGTLWVAIISVEGQGHQEPALVIGPNFFSCFLSLIKMGVTCQGLAAAAEKRKRSKLYIPGRQNGA